MNSKLYSKLTFQYHPFIKSNVLYLGICSATVTTTTWAATAATVETTIAGIELELTGLEKIASTVKEKFMAEYCL